MKIRVAEAGIVATEDDTASSEFQNVKIDSKEEFQTVFEVLVNRERPLSERGRWCELCCERCCECAWRGL